MDERDGNDHSRRMLDGKEARDVDLHRRAKIPNADSRDGTEKEIENETDEQLEIHADRQQQPPQFVLRCPWPSACAAADGAEPGNQPGEKDGPAEPGREAEGR